MEQWEKDRVDRLAAIDDADAAETMLGNQSAEWAAAQRNAADVASALRSNGNNAVAWEGDGQWGVTVKLANGETVVITASTLYDRDGERVV